MDAWIDREIEGCDFSDVRLKRRFGKLLSGLAQKMGDALPTACQDWAGVKAAYRFFDNPRVNEGVILAGHFAATRSRFADASGPMLVLHDTTEFSFQRARPELIGQTHRIPTGKTLTGKPKTYTACGLLMHSALVVTTAGVPLGLAAIKFWTRKKFKGTNALKKSINPTRVPIKQKESYRWIENVRQSTLLLGEPDRCVHIGDRESDIFELFCEAEQLGTSFLVRTCVDRLAGTGATTVSQQMKRQPIRGRHTVEVLDRRGRSSTADLRIRFHRLAVCPPIGKQKQYPALSLTVIHARENKKPEGRDRIEWKLLTNLPVGDLEGAVEKLDWYAMRWKIETFHKVLKSGCKAEDAKLRTADRLTNLMAVYCVVAWRVFWLCMLNREEKKTPAQAAFTTTELNILDHLDGVTSAGDPRPSLSHYVEAIAKLGGYLARKRDPPPGNMVLWRGLSRLTDIHLGFLLGNRLVGN